tara:strand:+ start:544 stop:1404 length:861 start_codon:yes stop_codon:yes gene_type:complete
MPLDFIDDNNLLLNMPTKLDFGVQFEPTKVQDKKYVINDVTGEYLGVVGHNFSCADHRLFFQGVEDAMTENLQDSQLDDAKVVWRSARNNSWGMMDITLPNVKRTIISDKHETKVNQRFIALHAIDGSCSNQVYYGAIDTFCTNGMITGDYDKVRRKNSSNFSMDRFIDELKNSRRDFDTQMDMFQQWAFSPIGTFDIKSMLDSLMGSESKSEKMYTLYNQEVSKRGKTVFALYSAFTNYASYADERNGFRMRNTGNDTQAQTMWLREQEVAKWIATPQFNQLVAA